MSGDIITCKNCKICAHLPDMPMCHNCLSKRPADTQVERFKDQIRKSLSIPSMFDPDVIFKVDIKKET